MSKGSDDLYRLLRKVYPNRKILCEYTIRLGRWCLFLDFYIPTLALAFEYDGKQHSEYTPFFHGSNRAGFEQSRNRDISKDSYCDEQGITLIRFSHTDKITKKVLLGKLKEANAKKEKRRDRDS